MTRSKSEMTDSKPEISWSSRPKVATVRLLGRAGGIAKGFDQLDVATRT